MILALAGGVGGAQLAQGLAVALPPNELAIVVNFRAGGFHSPRKRPKT